MMKSSGSLSFTLSSIALALSACSGGSTSTTQTGAIPSAEKWILVGDIAYCDAAGPSASAAAKTAGLVSSIIAQDSNTQILTLGDNVYSFGTPAEFASCYEPTWGQFKSRTWATPGNHDYGTPQAAGYYDYFGQSAGVDRSGYYRLDRNGWTILSLNSSIDVTDASPQMAWLKTQLAKRESCLMVVWHHPRFTSATRGDNSFMQPIWQAIVDGKADVVLQGHEHQYERFGPLNAQGLSDPNGTRSFVVGSGGAPLSDFASPRVGSEVRQSSYGVMRWDLSPGKAAWDFVDLNSNVLDAGSIACKV
jgi:acid phosphatase type 7